MSDVTAIRGATAVLPGAELPDALVILEGDRLGYIGPRDDDRIPAGARIVEAAGLALIPGLIDTHVHGSYGDDVMLSGPDGIRRISRRFAAHATTGWLPSTISARHPELLRAVRWCVEAGSPPGGARILGIHVEGPYINLKRKGAQPSEGVRDPDLDELEELTAAGNGSVRMVTLAPELPGALAMIAWLRHRGIVASIGHTDATYAEALAGIDAGATHATHLFNAMRPLHHRDPGVIAACLSDPRVVAEIIPDGVHLAPEIVRMAIRCCGRERTSVITDAFSATGLGEGVHTLGPHRVTVRGPLCTLTDGTIAGSILTMEKAVANVRRFAGVSLSEAVAMASHIPAILCGCADRKGSLEPGKDADVALLDPSGACVATWIGGEPAWSDGRL